MLLVVATFADIRFFGKLADFLIEHQVVNILSFDKDRIVYQEALNNNMLTITEKFQKIGEKKGTKSSEPLQGNHQFTLT